MEYSIDYTIEEVLKLMEKDEEDSETDSILTEEEEDSYESGEDSSEDWYDDGPSTNSTPAPKRKKCGTSSQSSAKSRSPHCTGPSQHWKTEDDPDVAPALPRFAPARQRGVHLDTSKTYSPLDLFQLFFSDRVIKELCNNTNKQAAKREAQGIQFKWTDVTPAEFLKYLALVIFMGLLKLGSIKDYWRQNNIFSVPFPCRVMSRDRWLFISSNLHMSDPAEDAVNDSKKGTPDYDPLFCLKPLMTEIRAACKSFYQPRKNLAVDERMVATKVKTGTTRYIKHRTNKWAFKLFVLIDSSNGYTSNFTVYTGKANFSTAFGLPYDAVVGLLDKPFLGSGYHVYCDHFYTSPQLFRHLSSLKFGACGLYRDSRKDTPKSTVNALSKKSERGSIRWIRDGDLLFVKWMDTREVAVCSTIHRAFTSEVVRRRQKTKDGTWEKISIPIPTPVVEYKKHMGGVDLSDQLIQYTSAYHKVMKWYKTLFLHFVDIATCNSFILHKELCAAQDATPLTHRAFMEELCAQLAGVTARVPAAPSDRATRHTPVPIAPLDPAKPGHRPADVRKYCEQCKASKIYNKTPWKCGACKAPLCNFLERPCFALWHV